MVRRFLNHFIWPAFRTRHRLANHASHLAEVVKEAERGHTGEVRLCIEGSLPLGYVLFGRSARDRAQDLFVLEKVWDTEGNTGVLVYILLAERALEIVCDRGVKAPLEILDEWVHEFTTGAEQSLHDALTRLVGRVGDHLRSHAAHAIDKTDELPNEPTLL